MRRPTQFGCLTLMVLGIAGCQGNQYAAAPPGWGQPPPGQIPTAPSTDWNARLSQLDESNRALHTQLAQSQRQAQVLRDQLQAVQRRLGDTAEQLRTAQEAQRHVEQQYATLQASTRRRGGATITANSSLRQSLQAANLNIPGVTVRQDGEVVRITLASDQLFQPGTTTLQPTMYSTLDQVATLVAQNYPRQKIGVEAHTDSAGGQRPHYVTSMQALAVLDYFTSRSRLPTQQFAAVGAGANHPLNFTPAAGSANLNRRLEIVVYPETF